MTRLSDIAVRVEAAAPSTHVAPDGGLGGGVAAVLAEVAGLLERLATTGGASAIDLRSLPMSSDDRAALQRILGTGEVRATLSAEGESSVCETGVPGVWWIEHRDQEGKLIAELVEITRVPDILTRAPDEIAAGARELRVRIRATPQRAGH